MSCKDYIAVARAVAETRKMAEYQRMSAQGALDYLTGELSDIFKSDNGRFDREKFRAAAA